MNTFTKSEIVSMLRKDIAEKRNQTLHALEVLYSFQSYDEQNKEETLHTNGKGFSSIDSKILTSMAKQYKKYGSLSEKQISFLQTKLPKYAKQLVEHSINTNKIKRLSHNKYTF